ncbi:phosphatase PAP2 family protein [Flavobacterium sp. DG1-102-2]|uniref:phosphatase PAP2 family protein n=1 Tax=Flavobacterium sp. DG1-102-2 TaxID=3081663 RepID=UPI00294A7C07|nr:phosphatase PAP2 family protein [Flavobacterium sp. DG1-102-2]MDV6169058.1 phosphatase PAP2 family protein [Flavobacterium sp. DG1-102-2]
MRVKGFLFVVLSVCSFVASAQTDSIVAPKEQARFKMHIPAVKDSVAKQKAQKLPRSNAAKPVPELKPEFAGLALNSDSLVMQSKAKSGFIRQTAIPLGMITAGVLLSKSGFEKSLKTNVRNAVGNDFKTGIDDYIRYAPIVQLYAADAFGVKAKNHWFDQTKNLAISYILTDFITNSLKKNVHKMRPNVSMGDESFPSAHTTQAFTTATVLYEEFKDSSPLLAYSGYVFAVSTGALRIMNNAHWFSDVVVGAGIGILVTKVVYMLDPLIKWNPFLKKKEVLILPQVAANEYGVYMSYKF